MAILFDVYGTLLVSSAGGIADEPAVHHPDSELKKAGRSEALLLRELNTLDFKGGPAEFHQALENEIHETKKLRQGAVGSEINVEALASRVISGPPAQIQRAVVLYECWRNPCSAMPGAHRLLRRLKGTVRLGLVSNAQFYTPLLIEALLGPLGRLGFEEQLSAFSFQRGIAKPYSQAFSPVLKALESEGIRPDRVVFVGNSASNDVAPARKLGLMTVLFAGDVRSYRPPPPGSDALPSTIVSRLSDVWTVSSPDAAQAAKKK